jgi:hypothetical protein
MTDQPILASRKTNNPYLVALQMVLARVRWDLRVESYVSRRRMRAMHDLHAGRKAVILCNGPSLLRTDFSLLAGSGAFVFGLNKINLLFDKTSLRPDAIVAVNPFVIEQNAEFFNSTELPLFLDSLGLGRIKSRSSVTFLHSSSVIKFARDCSVSICQGHTVTYVALQLAYHLGFTEVALVGCDHSFSQKGPANLAVVAGPRDVDHFDPNYFPAGVKWQLPDLAQSEASYLMAREVFEASGRRIVNCTEGGNLDVYERASLKQFLAND